MMALETATWMSWSLGGAWSNDAEVARFRLGTTLAIGIGMTSKTSQFRTILQNITCARYADRDAALAAIDTAYQAGKLSQLEQRKLEAAVG